MSEKLPAAEATVWGPINGMREADVDGSYLSLNILIGDKQYRTIMSLGAAETLADEINGALRRRSLRGRIQTSCGGLVEETDYQISCALRWYRRQGSRRVLMDRIDELERVLASRRPYKCSCDNGSDPKGRI